MCSVASAVAGGAGTVRFLDSLLLQLNKNKDYIRLNFVISKKNLEHYDSPFTYP